MEGIIDNIDIDINFDSNSDSDDVSAFFSDFDQFGRFHHIKNKTDIAQFLKYPDEYINSQYVSNYGWDHPLYDIYDLTEKEFHLMKYIDDHPEEYDSIKENIKYYFKDLDITYECYKKWSKPRSEWTVEQIEYVDEYENGFIEDAMDCEIVELYCETIPNMKKYFKQQIINNDENIINKISEHSQLIFENLNLDNIIQNSDFDELNDISVDKIFLVIDNNIKKYNHQECYNQIMKKVYNNNLSQEKINEIDTITKRFIMLIDIINIIQEHRRQDIEFTYNPENYNKPKEKISIDEINIIAPIINYGNLEMHTVCVICLDEFEIGMPVRKVVCGHIYHDNCISVHLTQHSNECPMCRHKIY